MHPLAFPNDNGCTTQHGEKIHAGDVVVLPDGRIATVDEILPDGDALLTFTDGTFGEAKWHSLIKETK